MPRYLTVVIPYLREDQRGPLLEAARRNGFEVSFFRSNAEALPHLAEAEVILGSGTELIRHAPKLRWFCSMTAGVEHYLRADVVPADVLFTNSAGAFGVSIAEHVMMVTLELLRNQEGYRRIMQERQWVRNLPFRSIKGSRILILGTGDIGIEAARRFRGFDPALIRGINRSGRCEEDCFDRIGTREDLEDWLPQTDILVMSLPGTPYTRHYLDAGLIGLLPPQAIVINVGRGMTIDQEALVQALQEGRIAGAALDVFEQEPVPQDSPLWEMPGLIMTPHISGNMALPYTVKRCVELFVEDLDRYCQGQPLLRTVDRKAGY